MIRPVSCWLAACAWAGVATGAVADSRPDPAAAERQYRLARRLAAERSPEAEAALARVVELDPRGTLADDALVDRAVLLGAAAWPEEIGRVDPAALGRAVALLDRVVESFPSSDRATEARFRRALARLEPVAGRDVRLARTELLAIATSRDSDAWGPAARYAVGWLDEAQGFDDRAVGVYERLIIDHATTESATRALAGLGRIRMRRGEWGHAAAWLQQAVETGADPRAIALRELAVRGVLRASGIGGTWSGRPRATSLDLRGPTWLVAVADGGVVVGDRKSGSLLRISAAGTIADRRELAGLQAIAADSLGRVFAAVDDRIVRVTDRGEVPVAGVRAMAPVGALAVEPSGTMWLVDRRGGRVATLTPGASASTTILEDRTLSIDAAVWDGTRLVAADGRTPGIFDIGAGRAPRPIGDVGFRKPTSVASDPAGQIAVLDARADEVVLLGPGGDERERLSTRAFGLERPVAVALAVDGALWVLDGSGSLVRIP